MNLLIPSVDGTALNSLHSYCFLFLVNQTNCLDIVDSVFASGYRLSLGEYDSKVSAITVDGIRDFMDRWTTDKCIAVSAIGPIEGLTDYLNLRMKMYWYRM